MRGVKINPGPLLMILAGLCFALMIACVKVLRVELSALEVMFWRGLVAAPLAAVLTVGRSRAIRAKRLFGLRITFGVGGMFCYYSATRMMPLADLTLVTRLQPILIAIVAPMVYGAAERSSGRVWGLLAAGMVGCGLLLAPRLALDGAGGGWWALGALTFSGAAHLCLRGLKGEDTRAVVLWMQVAIALVAGAGVVVWRGAPALPPEGMWGWALGVGVFATAGQLALTRAYALGRASVVAGASNVSPLWAVGLDVALFSVFPSISVLLGGALILGASLGLVVLRERQP
ncbi:MAG: DMT family transporter [Myxococcota bacterium]